MLTQAKNDLGLHHSFKTPLARVYEDVRTMVQNTERADKPPPLPRNFSRPTSSKMLWRVLTKRRPNTNIRIYLERRTKASKRRNRNVARRVWESPQKAKRELKNELPRGGSQRRCPLRLEPITKKSLARRHAKTRNPKKKKEKKNNHKKKKKKKQKTHNRKRDNTEPHKHKKKKRRQKTPPQQKKKTDARFTRGCKTGTSRSSPAPFSDFRDGFSTLGCRTSRARKDDVFTPTFRLNP